MTTLHKSEGSHSTDDTSESTRRHLFVLITRVAAGLVSLGLTIPAIGYLVSPAMKRRAQSWMDIASVDNLSVGEPSQLDCVMTVQDGYVSTTAHRAVWAVKQADGEVTVFSPMCTHLGCGYHWDGSDRKFKCPCHGSVYDVTGKVLAGPAPRHLDTLPAKVQEGRLLVMYKEFKAGVPVQVEL